MILIGLDMYQAYVREYYETEQKEVLLKLAFIPGMLLLVVCFVLFQLVDFSISGYFFGQGSQILDNCIFTGVVFLFCINLLSHVLRMQGRGWAFSAPQIIPKLGYLLFLLFMVLLYKERNYIELIITNVFVLFLSTLCFVFILWEDIKKAWAAKYNKIIIKQMLTFSLPLLAGSLAYWALISIDRLILSYFTNFKEVGIYVVATSLAAGVGVFATVFSNLWHPLVYKWVKEGIDPKRIAFINELMVLAVSFLWSLVGFFSWSIEYFFPKQYDGVQYIVVACVAMPLLYMLSETTNVGIGISRKTGYAMITSLVALLVNIVVNCVAVPLHGVKGTALASMMTFISFLILRTEFSSFLWVSLPRGKMYIFLMIYFVLTVMQVFEIFNNIFVSSIAWVLGFVVICVLYFDKISWGFEKVKLRGFKC